MSICIRFVKDAAVYERFVTFVNVHELNALSLAAEIVRNLLELGLPLSQCVAQCYDGAAVMAGRCQGVQVHVREQCKSPCLYVHCHAHRLNLVLVSASTCCKCTRINGRHLFLHTRVNSTSRLVHSMST